MHVLFEFKAHCTTILEAQRLAQSSDRITLVGGKQLRTIEVDDAALALSLVEENHEITTPNNAGIFVRSAFFHPKAIKELCID